MAGRGRRRGRKRSSRPTARAQVTRPGAGRGGPAAVSPSPERTRCARILDRLYDGALALAAAVPRRDRGACAGADRRAPDRPGARACGHAAAGPRPCRRWPRSAAFLFVSAVFLGMAGTLRAGGHVRVTLLTRACHRAPARCAGLAGGAGAAGASRSSPPGPACCWCSTAGASARSVYGMVKVPLWRAAGGDDAGAGLFCAGAGSTRGRALASGRHARPPRSTEAARERARGR